MGVPHIYGETKKDSLFAVGYAMAEDRLFQIEMVRRAGMGELAAIFGEELVPLDKKARVSGYTEAELEGMVEAMDPDMKVLFQSMVSGINHYVEEALANPAEKKPLEFTLMKVPLRKYRAADILAALSTIVRLYSTAGGNELLNQKFFDELAARYGEEKAKIIFDDVLVITDPDAYATMSDRPLLSRKSIVPQFDTTLASRGNIDTILKEYQRGRHLHTRVLGSWAFEKRQPEPDHRPGALGQWECFNDADHC